MECVTCKEGEVVVHITEDIEVGTTEDGCRSNAKEDLIDSRVTAVYCDNCSKRYRYDPKEEKVVLTPE